MAAQPIYQPQVLPARYQRLMKVLRKAGEILLVYWALAITIFLGIIVVAALSVPVLTYLGLNNLAKPLFFTLHLICAQIPSHSFYILGHQLGMCARNMAIYTSMFIGGMVFVLSKKRLRGIPWWFWLLLILPMAYDGLTQMVGWRESTWELRVITGALFGFGNMWFALPLIHRTVTDALVTPGPLYGPAPTTQPLVLPAGLSALQTPLPLAEAPGQSAPSTPAAGPDEVKAAPLVSEEE
jgi:uncharacterized membrane protein